MIDKQTNNTSFQDDFIIYSFNAKDCLMFPVIKEHFELTDTEIYNTILSEYKMMRQRLINKGLKYDDLKGALLPNQEKDKYETCLIFDSSKIDECNYGGYIFSKLLPLLDDNSTYSILCGDYIDILDTDKDSQTRLRLAMNDVIIRCNNSTFCHSSQYYIVYFNRLTESQRWEIVKELINYDWFTGFADVSHISLFKTYLSFILTHSFIKNRKKIISSHPCDYLDEDNINILGYPFEKNGYSFFSINEDSFGLFLSYKIESDIPDETDVGFSFNAIFPKFNSIKKLRLKIEDNKWNDYLIDENKKGKIVKALGYDISDKDIFIQEIYKKICSSYIYKLERRKYDETIWKFCVCIDMPTIDNNFRKTTVVLKYYPDNGDMFIVTIT